MHVHRAAVRCVAAAGELLLSGDASGRVAAHRLSTTGELAG
jgi:hypothetical protein